MQLRCAPVWWKCASAIYSTQRVLVRTSDCGTFDPYALSNVSFAPEASPIMARSAFTQKRTSPPDQPCPKGPTAEKKPPRFDHPTSEQSGRNMAVGNEVWGEHSETDCPRAMR